MALNLAPRALTFPLALFLATLATGCSQKVLDYRNLEIVNGKVFANGSDKPFSGQVTNIPDNELLKGQDGFLALAEVIVRSFDSRSATATNTIAGADAPYVLHAASYYCDVNVENGLFDGKVVCKVPRTENVTTEASFTDGKLKGPMKYFNAQISSDVVSDANFEEGLLDGMVTVYGDRTGKPVARVPFRQGGQEGAFEYLNQDSGAVVVKGSAKAGKFDGEVLQMDRSGQHKVSLTRWVNGTQEGLQEYFDPDLGTRETADFFNGAPNGHMKKWDASGNLWSDSVYKNGKVVVEPLAESAEAPKPLLDIDDCVNDWITAHRREVGDDEPITFDQRDEWHAWCQEGKRPSAKQ